MTPGCLENLARNQFPVCGHFLSDDKNKSIVFVFDITVHGPGKDSSFHQLIFSLIEGQVIYFTRERHDFLQMVGRTLNV